MTVLTRDEVRQIRLDIAEALKTVQTKHGMSFSLGTIRFDTAAGKMRGTLEGIKYRKPGGEAPSDLVNRTDNPLVGAALKTLGIDPTKTYYTPKIGTFKVVDYVPRRHRYPISIFTTAGRSFKLTVDFIKQAKVIE